VGAGGNKKYGWNEERGHQKGRGLHTRKKGNENAKAI